MIHLLVVDHKNTVSELRRNLFADKYHLLTAKTGFEAINLLKSENTDVATISANLPGGVDGISLLRKLKEAYPLVEIVMIIRCGSVDDATRSMKVGAYDCMGR